MTIKARNFRIGRRARDEQETTTEPSDQPPLSQTEQEAEIWKIQAEGLSGRQLRMARRTAQRNGIKPSSDYDAVLQLRNRGIDPFSSANMMDIAVGSSGKEHPGTPAPPQAIDRARAIRDIQIDIARRRRRNLFLLSLRLLLFVMVPTFFAGFYYYNVATPIYATHSEIVIQRATPPSAEAGGGLLSGNPLANSQDSITVQGYLQSRDAMLRLDEEQGFKAHFSRPELDPILRLPSDASMEDTYKLYRDMVIISYDPTEGIIKLQIKATDPETSTRYAHALIGYAEEIVDNLSDRVRADQVRGAEQSYLEAETNMETAQQRVIELQEQYNVISTDVEVNLLVTRISSLEAKLMDEQLSLDEMMASPNPSTARLNPLERRIETLQTTIADLRSQLTRGTEGEKSLARIGSELEIAQTELEIRTLLLQESLQALVAARTEADRQTLYLETGVRPIPPDQATFPRAFENTILAFLIFSGIYLMLSLTASILHEQVTA